MIDFHQELNTEQYAAVASTGDRVLVLAGAGSGKTRTLTYRVAWLLEQGIKPWQILLLTFTNKAANEMLERVQTLAGVSRAEIWGGTFHSISLRILRKQGELVGLKENFTILDADDAEKLFANIVKKLAPEVFKGGKRAVKPAVFLTRSATCATRKVVTKKPQKTFLNGSVARERKFYKNRTNFTQKKNNDKILLILMIF